MTDAGSGELVLAGTPIGSHRDASAALKDLLASADVVAAEDTRRFLTLARRLGVTPAGRVVSYFEGNEAERTQLLVDAVAEGQTVALVTDAGMPSISDPGFRVVGACIERGLRVTAVPGPSAVLTALAVSGLPSDRFCFEGFLPRKDGARRARLAELAGEERTMVFFEAPHRLAEFLASAAGVLGDDRAAVVCRELTKPFEEVVRGTLAGLREWAGGGVRGEVTVVVAGAARGGVGLDDAVAEVLEEVGAGGKLAAVVRDVAARTGTNRKALYEAALQARASGRENR